MSRKVRFGSYTRRQLITDCCEDLNVFTDEYMPPPRIAKVLNDVVVDMWGLQGGIDATEYSDSEIIPVQRNVFSNAETGSNYDSTARRLTLPGPGTGNILWTNAPGGFTPDWLNGKVTLTDTSTGLVYQMKIITVEDSGNVILYKKLAPFPPTIIAANLVVQGYNGADINADEIDLTQLEVYKRIEIIKYITSTALNNSLCLGPKAGEENDWSKGFGSKKVSDNWADSILWDRPVAEKLEFNCGFNLRTPPNSTGAPFYGVREMFFVATPAPMLADGDLIDVRDKYIKNVRDAVKVVIVNTLPPEKVKIALPQELVKWWQDIQAQKQAKMQEKSAK